MISLAAMERWLIDSRPPFQSHLGPAASGLRSFAGFVRTRRFVRRLVGGLRRFKTRRHDRNAEIVRIM